MELSPALEIVIAVVAVISSIAGIHFTLTNRANVKVGNIAQLWKRLDEMDKKITEMSEANTRLQRRINFLENYMRRAGVPVPDESSETVTEPAPITGFRLMK